MQRVFTLYRTTIGKKVLMALSGVVLFGYCIGHMAGNLQIFAGAGVLNDYSHMLHRTVWLLWGTRILLLVAVAVHIVTTVQLVRLQMEARPIAYRQRRTVQATYASRTMRWSGPFIALFVLFHLAHLTWGLPVVPADYVEGDVFANLVHGFRIPWVAFIYVVSASAVGLHLSHGAWSMFQTMGITHPRYTPKIKAGAKLLTAVVAFGFIIVPLAVLFGLVKLVGEN